jgi:carboxyl-terminal processing protease
MFLSRFSYLFFLFLIFYTPLSLAQKSDAQEDYDEETLKLLNTFGEVFEKIRRDYVEDISDKKLIEAAISGMVSSLDPHSSYLNAESFRNTRQQTSGEFGGLGMEITVDRESGFVEIIAPLDDSPASKNGLMAGDLITHVDKKSIHNFTIGDAVDLIKGPAGRNVTLTIIRNNQPPFNVTIRREKIRVQSVRSRLEKDIGYIRLTSFNERSYDELQKAIKTLEKDSPVGYILDLRNNPGGLLDQAIRVTDAFLERGEIVSTRGREQVNHQRYQAKKGDLINGKPLVLLINRGSASASEIVSGALQDHKRAIIIGTRSFGKASVQTIIPLANQKDSAVKLTIQRYFTPSGESIQKRGIVPDITVFPSNVVPIEQAAQREEASLRGALDNNQEDSSENREEETSREIDDYQLSRAIDLIRGIALYGDKAQSQ